MTTTRAAGSFLAQGQALQALLRKPTASVTPEPRGVQAQRWKGHVKGLVFPSRRISRNDPPREQDSSFSFSPFDDTVPLYVLEGLLLLLVGIIKFRAACPRVKLLAGTCLCTKRPPERFIGRRIAVPLRFSPVRWASATPAADCYILVSVELTVRAVRTSAVTQHPGRPSYLSA